MDRTELCALNHVTIHRVGDVYDHDGQGCPIPASEKDKGFVAIRAGDFPTPLVSSIPLADTEDQAMRNAVNYLALQTRCPVCREAVQAQAIPGTAMWKLILYSGLAISAMLVGALQLDGLINTGFEFTAPAFIIAGALVAVGLLAMFLSRKDSHGFYCHQCGYSE